MSDSGPSTPSAGSLPAFAIVISVLVGILALVLVVYLLLRRHGKGSYNFLAKKAPAYPKAGGRIIFPPDESNPRPPSHVPLRPMSLSHTSYPPFTGAPAPPGNFHEESQALLGPRQGDKREYRQAKPEYYRPPTGDMRYPPQGKSNAPSTPLRSPAPNYPTSYRPPLAPTRPQHQNTRLPSTQATQPSQSYQHMYPSPVRQQGSYQSSKGGRFPA